MSLEYLGLYFSIAGVLGTLLFGWLRWRRDVIRDTAALLRECDRERRRLQKENVELMRRLIQHERERHE